ncbi:hypothetical protein LIER_15313 [Lithospermum erythrorhizon]|uniref:PAP/OAS1 substrate-binding domain superfamily n=1 Tax=Lithospermum erythrorhizon TaxID=34254 RepID=A0AAV3Q2S0_LITER
MGDIAIESSIGAYQWGEAERVTHKIINKVQPTYVSEQRRIDVIHYIQTLIRTRLGCQVFPYGSVPLKTYLPDGDIDLTAFGGINDEDTLPSNIASVLEREEQNETAEFVVKDVQLIRAEVKLVKCIVQNIVVDISINQIGGLCTLCFLEQVDRLIAEDHLFKRSILLIKAWCYYESRILGAHHALISTYALETLVLYIFHLFHSMLDGPLAVLYKFLDYFSKFDWENYCVSLTGPVHVSSLPEIIAETPENDGNGLLLTGDFLRNCFDMFHVPSRGGETNQRTFQEKHLNIVDPLKDDNNLGRSVSKGNFYRIKSAFTYGARKLGRILLQPEDNIAIELHNFFLNTLERHGHGERPDVQDSGPLLSHYQFNPDSEFAERNVGCTRVPVNSRTYPDGASDSRVVSTEVAKVGSRSFTENGNHNHTLNGNGFVVELDGTGDFTGSQIQGLKLSNDIPRFAVSGLEENISEREIRYHAPHLFFSNMNGYDELAKSPSKQLMNSDKISVKVSPASADIGFVQDDNLMVSTSVSLDPKTINYSMKSGMDHEDNSSGSPKSAHSFSDLTGDYDIHINCLQYGRWWYEYGSSIPVLPMPLMLPHFEMKMPYEAMMHPPHFKRNGYSHGNVNDIIQNSAFYGMNPLVIPPCVSVGLEDMPRGTGTYFPNTNRPSQVSRRPSAGKSRKQPTQFPRSNVRTPTFPETNNHDRSSCGSPQSNEPSSNHGISDVQHSFSVHGKGHSIANDSVSLPEGFIELSSGDQLAVPSLERSRQQKYSSFSSSPNSSPVLKPVHIRDDRFSLRSSAYRLRDEDDFPPLSNRGDTLLD